MMYPEVRAAVAADAGGGLGAPGFDLAAHREEARLANLRLPREDVASVEDVDADGVPVPALRPRRRRCPASSCTRTAAASCSTTSTSTTASPGAWPTGAVARC